MEKIAALHTQNQEYAKHIEGILKNHLNIDTEIENYLGHYVLSVEESKYEETLEYARMHFEQKKVGSVNIHGELRNLNEMSLVYVNLVDFMNASLSLEIPDHQPLWLRKLIMDLTNKFGCPVRIRFNGSDVALEILADKQDWSNQVSLRNEVISLIDSLYTDYLYEALPCTKTGKVLSIYEKEETLPYQNLFNGSMFMVGLKYPEGNNLSPKSDCDNNLDESGYWISGHRYGLAKLNITGEETESSDYNLKGSIGAFEKMFFNSTWDAKTRKSNSIMNLESTLMDAIEFETEVELVNENECVFTTKYRINRKAMTSYSLPFGIAYPTNKSVRNGILPYPLEDGVYEGVIKESFSKVEDGTKLIHTSENSNFFEIYEIDPSFDFKTSSLPNITSVHEISKKDEDIKKLTVKQN